MGLVGLRDVFVVAPAYHHHHHHHHQDATLSGSNAAAAAISADQINGGAAATALGVGVIPLLTAGPSQTVEDSDSYNNFLSNNNRNRIQLWQNQSSQPHNQTQYLPLKNQPSASHHLVQVGRGNYAGGIGGVGSGSNSGSGLGTATCQDCGNQAKKECSNSRCRTCCKSRGFDCATHVKSTWVPAARRRERQLMATTAGSSSVSTSGTKKPKLIIASQNQQQQQTTSHTSTSNTTPPRSFDTSSSHQDAGNRDGWPRQVRAQAVFKCVRVTALEDGEDEYAYQAVVKIGGHVFKGFLYDQGVESKDGFPNISDLHLGGGGRNNPNNDTNTNNNGTSSSSPILDATNVYGGSGGGGGGFLAGPGYGNQMS